MGLSGKKDFWNRPSKLELPNDMNLEFALAKLHIFAATYNVSFDTCFDWERAFLNFNHKDKPEKYFYCAFSSIVILAFPHRYK